MGHFRHFIRHCNLAWKKKDNKVEKNATMTPKKRKETRFETELKETQKRERNSTVTSRAT